MGKDQRNKKHGLDVRKNARQKKQLQQMQKPRVTQRRGKR